MAKPFSVLILGGYGTFGARLARLLCGERRVKLLIAGRHIEKARQFCAALPGAAGRTALRFDRDADVLAQLRAIEASLVVDASGPFQAYGESPYRVVEACLQCGIPYVDLADGSGFVRGITRFDDDAQARGIFALSGASTFPVLTAAVVRTLVRDLASVERIVGGVAPSPYAGVGLNVMRAIASYAGRPIRLRRGKRTQRAYALTETQTYVIAPPGRLPLRPIEFSLVDVPDLEMLADLWPEIDSVWMGAGPLPAILHRILRGLAWLVRLRILPSLSPLAPAMHWVSHGLHWGEHRGGMFVEVSGVGAEGRMATRSWHLLAEADDGPLIPSMAAAAVVRRCISGRPPAAGARAALRDFEIEDYESMFAGRTIYTGTRNPSRPDDNETLYRRLLGDAWQRLPEPIRVLHDVDKRKRVAGVAQIERGKGLLARLVATVFRFPPAGDDVAVIVEFDESQGRQIWTRRFGTHVFASRQEAGRGRFDRLLCERFGLFAFGLAVVSDDRGLELRVRGWNCMGVNLPGCLAPRIDARESVADGRFHFHVDIALPAIGPLVRYRGWLVPAEPSGQPLP